MAEYKPILLSLPSLTPSLAVEVLPHGMTIHRIYVQADGKTHDIVIGPEAPEDHSVVKYTNTIIGRYANRVPVGTHTVEKDGITSQFTAITNESPQVSLHGGPKGFDFGIWERLSSSTDVTLFTPAELKSISTKSPGDSSWGIFRLVSEDGDQGYSGTLLMEVLIALLSPEEGRASGAERPLGSIVIVYRAKLQDSPDGSKQVTPINLTQHWGFNLDASLQEGEETLSVLNHKMDMKASHVAELLPNFLPSGKYDAVAGADNSSGAHLHLNKRIGDQFPGIGYDHYYLLSQPGDSPHRIPVSKFTPDLDEVTNILNQKRSEPVVQLSSEKSGLAVEFDTNRKDLRIDTWFELDLTYLTLEAGLMFYTNNHANTKGYRKKIHGGSGVKGDGYIAGSAAFIEFHEPLSAFLYPTSNSTDTLLASGEVYNNFVRADVLLRQVEHTGA
ncbi:galactose mutarotase-like domain-containing protein [Hygrophoropsis aurantiaca]|uniref:Galactose mutarotase-like domain-containing protein n=1 Tax=Hygrophoropsis aurantiaca TaxID=72124 RepID=A0ACB8AKP9_9AGAM|nr:galactose mutarotase-like domain-containing protein [Hygrophoropsis aurantiaca]